MNEINFNHQLCTFHLENTYGNQLIKKQTIAKKYRAQLKKENLNFSKTKLNKMRDEKKKEFKEEICEFIELFMAFKDKQKWKKAQKLYRNVEK